MKTLALLLLLSIPAFGQSQPFAAIVKRCYDGDNVTIAYERSNKTITRNVRLVGIDAPERRGHQPHNVESQAQLCGALPGREVRVEPRGFDTKWRRMIAKVSFNGDDLSFRQVALGAAWFYRQYARSLTVTERVAYIAAEAEARESKRGLWAGDDAPIPPWQWRKGARPGVK